jgi:hypothetical protein
MENDFENLYSIDNGVRYDANHLDDVIHQLEQLSTDNDALPASDVLNGPISRDEVYKAIERAKCRKAAAGDNIPAEVLKNNCSVDIN